MAKVTHRFGRQARTSTGTACVSREGIQVDAKTQSRTHTSRQGFTLELTDAERRDVALGLCRGMTTNELLNTARQVNELVVERTRPE